MNEPNNNQIREGVKANPDDEPGGEKLFRIVICARVTRPLKAGSFAGYFCKTCRQPLQVSAMGCGFLESGKGVAFCNRCGFALCAEALKLQMTMEAEFGPAALEELSRRVREKNKLS